MPLERADWRPRRGAPVAPPVGCEHSVGPLSKIQDMGLQLHQG